MLSFDMQLVQPGQDTPRSSSVEEKKPKRTYKKPEVIKPALHKTEKPQSQPQTNELVLESPRNTFASGCFFIAFFLNCTKVSSQPKLSHSNTNIARATRATMSGRPFPIFVTDEGKQIEDSSEIGPVPAAFVASHLPHKYFVISFCK